MESNQSRNPARIYFFKVNHEDPPQNNVTVVIWYLNVNSEQISQIVLVFPLLNLNKKMLAGYTYFFNKKPVKGLSTESLLILL